nr:unnamed protein product [Digitaria exilis]
MDELQPLTPKQKRILDPKQKQVSELMFMHCGYIALLRPFRSWEEKVAMILHVVRQREFTDYDPKAGCCLPHRFSLYNIAFFDFDKESEVVHGPKFRDISPYKYDELEFLLM